MIYATGSHPLLKSQVQELMKRADDSFCVNSSDEFMISFPVVEGWEPAEMNATLLRLKCVEPHDDPFVGADEEPKVRRAIFWLVRGGGIGRNTPLIFGCGTESVTLNPGDYVVFDDSVDHWVMSEKVWYGAAIQLIEE
jgi:hypothetical protein